MVVGGCRWWPALVVVLMGCSSAPAAPSPTLVATVAPTATTTVAPSPTARPTATATTAATATPTASTTATPVPRVSLQEAVQASLARHQGQGHVAVVVRKLSSGETVSVDADREFTAASLYKLFVLDSAMQAIADGALDRTAELSVTAASVAADPYSDLQAGTRLSADCALRTMIEMSGNSAADVLVRQLGRSRISAEMHNAGLQHSAFTADGAVTSAGDVAQLLEQIASGTAINQQASQRMLELLLAQQHNDRLPAPLPLSVRVAHKTGELPGLRHDAGVVYAPSGAYVVVVLVEDAPSESDARSAIVDVSDAAYAAIEPETRQSYAGLPPRIAQAVLRLSDDQGRLTLLGDPRTETTAVRSRGVAVVNDADDVRLRPEAVADLLDLQHAAAAAGTPFWVRDGFVQPTDADVDKAVPSEWLLPCAVEQPARVADRERGEKTNVASQRWLGTVLSITDNQSGEPTSADDVATPAGAWLRRHAAEHGFVPAVRDDAQAREPWTLRWVGRDIAQRIAPAIDSAAYATTVHDVLARAASELAAQQSGAPAPAWDLGTRCWLIATTSTRGCPSRWYFLQLPLS